MSPADEAAAKESPAVAQVTYDTLGACNHSAHTETASGQQTASASLQGEAEGDCHLRQRQLQQAALAFIRGCPGDWEQSNQNRLRGWLLHFGRSEDQQYINQEEDFVRHTLEFREQAIQYADHIVERFCSSRAANKSCFTFRLWIWVRANKEILIKIKSPISALFTSSLLMLSMVDGRTDQPTTETRYLLVHWNTLQHASSSQHLRIKRQGLLLSKRLLLPSQMNQTFSSSGKPSKA